MSDVNYLTEFIITHIGLQLNHRTIKYYGPILKCWGGLQCQQYPNELAQFLVFLNKNRKHINSYFEIGVNRAGTFMLIDSFLRLNNNEYRGSLGIDTKPRVRNRSCRARFEEYNKKYPTCKFLSTDSNTFMPDEQYDLCFIDGFHEEPTVSLDFNKALKHSKIIAIHDIFWEKDIISLWEKIKETYPQKYLTEIKNHDNRFHQSIGIGIYHPTI